MDPVLSHKPDPPISKSKFEFTASELKHIQIFMRSAYQPKVLEAGLPVVVRWELM